MIFVSEASSPKPVIPFLIIRAVFLAYLLAATLLTGSVYRDSRNDQIKSGIEGIFFTGLISQILCQIILGVLTCNKIKVLFAQKSSQIKAKPPLISPRFNHIEV